MSQFSKRIQAVAQARNITSLLHFTPARNAQSIFEIGFLSRKSLDLHEIDHVYTDGWRNDGAMDGISFSIEGINEPMFASKIKQSAIPWVIFRVDAQVLWTHRCLFCWTNAASSEVAGYRGPLDTSGAFERMFEDRPLSSSDPRMCRTVHAVPDERPTLLDAEVQVLEPISQSLITGVFIEGPDHEQILREWFDATGRSIPITVFPEAFSIDHLSRSKFG